MMETTMYEEAPMNGSLKQLKSKMTLDFGSGKAKKTNLLSSPDLNICTLASPELERIIIQQNGMVTTTPTPTQFLFPKAVTEEQEAYARGFINALEELRNQGKKDEEIDGITTMTTLQPVQAITSDTNAVSVAQSQHAVAPMPTSTYSFATTTALPGNDNSLQSTAPMPTIVSQQQQQDMVVSSMDMDLSRTSSPMLPQTSVSSTTTLNGHQRVMQLKEEPQTVPCYNTPPMSPINMEAQERCKIDRKRARNRVAARKCRYRKLERIQRLEDRVKDLTGQKNQLADNATALRDQVARLKQQIMEHVNSGCKVMLNSNLL